jgi:hypothetical protein
MRAGCTKAKLRDAAFILAGLGVLATLLSLIALAPSVVSVESAFRRLAREPSAGSTRAFLDFGDAAVKYLEALPEEERLVRAVVRTGLVFDGTIEPGAPPGRLRLVTSADPSRLGAGRGTRWEFALDQIVSLIPMAPGDGDVF